MKKATVSVIVPIYGVEKYLQKCVDSILSQTLHDIEIILVDDGSQDRCPEIVDEYAKKDPRIIAVHKPNGGYGSAVNHGIKCSSGDYIGIVEPDDFIDPSMYEKLYNKAQESEADLVKGLFFYFYENESQDNLTPEVHPFVLPSKVFSLRDCPGFLYRHPSIWSCLYRREFLENHKIFIEEAPGDGWTDNLFQVQTMCLADRIACVNEPLYYWRCYSRDLNKKLSDWRIPLTRMRSIFEWVNGQGITDTGILSCLYRRLFSYIRISSEQCPLSDIFSCAEQIRKMIKGVDANIVSHPNIPHADKKLFKKMKKHCVFSIMKLKRKYKKRSSKNSLNIFLIKLKLFFILNPQKKQLYKSFYQGKTLADIYDYFQDYQINKRANIKFDLQHLIRQIKRIPCYVHVDSHHNFLNVFLNMPPWHEIQNYPLTDNVLLCWEIRPIKRYVRLLKEALGENKTILFVGDSFLRSVNTFADKKALPRYQKGISFTFDDLTSYFDATRPSRMEMMLNNKNLTLTSEQKERARRCIDKIITNHLTKYNSQPIFTPDIGRKGVKKVLVVDQSYGDMSIAKGLGSDQTFVKMLQLAIDENPDADIIVKTHPDTMAGQGGYYTGLKEHDNVYTQTTPINPISLIQYCDKVYVCTTQFGFEALMCGKEVRVFGMPFYAGWGLTKDEQLCERRTNRRTLEEIFYIAYIMYSYYVNPETGKQCEIEEAMDYLIDLREEYFKQLELD